jgi:hypothetical protein
VWPIGFYYVGSNIIIITLNKIWLGKLNNLIYHQLNNWLIYIWISCLMSNNVMTFQILGKSFMVWLTF